MSEQTSPAWKVRLNDYEIIYVFADSEQEAKDKGVDTATKDTGFNYGEESEEGSEVTAERCPVLDGHSFTMAKMVHHKLASPEALGLMFLDDEAFDPHEPESSIYLTTEW